jgi:hypothetical protein
MEAKVKKEDFTLVTIIFAFFVFFTASDLAFNAFSQLEFASVCSFASGFLVFLGSFVVKKKNIEKGVNNRIDYIVSNFTWGNKVLGVLDFIFSLIALFTAVYWLGLIFRIGIIVRLACTLNKVKSVVKTLATPLRTLLTAMFVYLAIRFKPIKNKIKESVMWAKIKQFFQWIYANKKTLIGSITALATSIATAYATYGGQFSFLPPLMWLGINWTSVIVAIVIFVLLELGVTGKGFEKIATFVKRVTELKEAKEESQIEKQALKEIKEAEKAANQTQAEQEKAEAKAQAKAEAEAKAAEEEQAYRAKVEAKKAEILASQNAEQAE